MTQNHKTLTMVVLAGLILTTAAWAQFGGGPLVPPAANPFGGQPNSPITPGGGNPFGRGRMPFAAGTVSAVDAAAGTITLKPLFGGAGQAVKVTDTSQITALAEAKVGDLKVGDKVQVRGVPTGITASQITAGESGDTPLGGMGMPVGRMPVGAGVSGMAGPQAAAAQAAGKITGLSPLTISVSDSVQVTLKAAPDVKVSRYVSEKIGDLKAGDHILASGQTGDDGVFTASRIRVNADLGMGRR